MYLSLLHTKFQPVSLGNTILERPDLLERLDAGAASTVTLVTAPAGFGKSTLISSWVEHIAGRAQSAGRTRPQVCWLSLEGDDSHFPKFLLYLVASIEEKRPDSCREIRELAQARPTPAIETLAEVLINVLSRQEEPIVLVLDDLHRIGETAVFVFLGRLIEFAPPHLHLVLISRVDPPLPLSRWRAAGRLREFRLRDLSFSSEEMTAFFRINLDNMPPVSLIESIHRSTEGWIVGGWLALLALRGHQDYTELARHFQDHGNRYAVDYLVDEVLSQLTPEVRTFLVSTAILNQFCAELCAAVLDISPDAAAAQIEHLLRTNLFVIESGAPGLWYRYHSQFRQMLLSRLTTHFDQSEIAALHRRATAWLVGRKLITEGLSHLLAIPDYTAAADLVAAQQANVLNELNFPLLEAWLSQIPLSLLNQRADLLAGMAWVKRAYIDHEACLTLHRQANELLDRDPDALSPRNRQLLGAELKGLQAWLEKSSASEATLARVRQSWDTLREDLALSHCSVVLALAYTSQELGELDFAREVVRTTLQETPNWPLAARCRVAHAAGFFHLCSGDSAEAEKQFRRNLLLAEQHTLPIIALISRHGLGAIADLRNQLDQAKEHHLEVIRQPYLTTGRDAVVDMYSLIGIYARGGEQEKSRALVGELMASAQLAGKPFFLEQVAALDAYTDLTCGKQKRALLWALSVPDSQMSATFDRIPLIRTRILLAEASEACLLKAEQILQELRRFYSNSHVWYRQTEILVLQALVKDGLGQADSALATLAEAVDLAVPKGGIGLFMGYGKAIEHLLQKLGTQPALSHSVVLLLTALATEDVTPKQDMSDHGLAQPLTERELSVLHLLAARFSNKEIARQLVVSPHTVRNHTANIYGKLQVSNRREAVQQAYAIGLLPASTDHKA